MRHLAVIPARGGSKRLPRKNILPFMDKPMLVWTAEAAHDAGIFSRVIISTEDGEIASTGRNYGFEVFLRPADLASDQAPCAQVCLHLLEELARAGEVYDTICCLYATAPLRRAEDIVATVALLGDEERNEADFAFAVTNYSHSPYQALCADETGFLSPAFPLLVGKKSQELPACCIGNGSTYAARVPAFCEVRGFYGPRLKGYPMQPLRSIDIDTAEDYEAALRAASYLLEETHAS